MSHFVTLVNFYMPKLEENCEENMRYAEQIAEVKEKLAQDPESFALRFLLKRLQSKASTLERSAECEIDELMAPFCEGTDDPAYLEFEDRTDDLRRDYETDKINCVRFPDGTVVPEYNRLVYEKYLIKDGKVFQKKAGHLGHEKRTKKAKKMRAFMGYPVKKLYPSLKQYAEDYCGYTFDSKNNVYATVSKGYRSGGYNIQMFSDLIQNSMRNDMMNAIKQDEVLGKFAGMMPEMPASDVNVSDATLYKPEYSWNYEVGSHTTLFDDKLQADVALFYMDTRNQQISRFAESGLGRITVNAGKSRSLGAEASVRAQLTNAFSLSGNYGYTYATFTDYVVSDTENYNGNYVPFVPKHTFNVGAQYVFTMRKGAILDNITVNANYKAAGRIYWTEQNDVSQSFYGTLNWRTNLEIGDAMISFWARNFLNKDYAAFYFETMNKGFMQKGRPMQFGVDLRCRF